MDYEPIPVSFAAGLAWYTWETRQIGLRAARQYNREWQPQCHFSFKGLDPTTGTGALRAETWRSLELIAHVVNVGRPAIVIRGFILNPEETVGTITNIEPGAVVSGEKRDLKFDIDSMLLCLQVSNKIGHSADEQNWRGKIALQVWFEAAGGNYKSPEQFFEVEIKAGQCVYLRQMTQVEFKYLERLPISV